MGIKDIYKFVIFSLMASSVFASCVIDHRTALCIRNCEKDTFFLELTESSVLDNGIYFDRDSENMNVGVFPEDTTEISIHGEKVIFWNQYCTLPDSMSFHASYLFDIQDTCYIYAIRRQVAMHYSLDEIREQGLYDRQVVTKKDFHNGVFEYRYLESSAVYH